MRFRKSLLEKQIDVFLEWGKRSGLISPSYEAWLGMFADSVDKKDVMDISTEDVDLFMQKIYNEFNSSVQRRQALTAVRSIIKFYMARGKNVTSKRGPGRPHKVDLIEKAQALKKANPGLSLSQIGLLMAPKRPVDKATVHRWLRLPLKEIKELSTEKK